MANGGDQRTETLYNCKFLKLNGKRNRFTNCDVCYRWVLDSQRRIVHSFVLHMRCWGVALSSSQLLCDHAVRQALLMPFLAFLISNVESFLCLEALIMWF